MKKLCKPILVSLLLLLNFSIMGQSKDEEIIRVLEQQEAAAVISGDTVTLFQTLWAPEFIVNNPANFVVTKEQVVQLISTGKIDYESFDRIIERISIIDNIAIVMGREDLRPQGKTDHAGKQEVRRFTNVWIHRNGRWQLVARQASITAFK